MFCADTEVSYAVCSAKDTKTRLKFSYVQGFLCSYWRIKSKENNTANTPDLLVLNLEVHPLAISL